MKSLFNKIFLALLILGISNINAQIDRSKIPTPAPAPEFKIPETKKFTLENGLKIFVVENHKTPKVTFNLVFDYPPVYEGELAGLSQVFGEILGTATKNKSKSEIDETIDFIGANLYTSASGIYGSVLSKYKERFFGIVSDVVTNAKFTKEELEKVKKRKISEIKNDENNPTAIANNAIKSVLYGKNSPYGNIPTVETVEKIKIDNCKEFYNSNIMPNISYLAIVGDINFNEAKELVEKYFSSWQKGIKPQREFKTKRSPLIRKVALVDREESVQSIISVAYPVKFNYNSKDLIAAKIMNQIFGGNFMSHLNMNLREKHGFTYGARSSLTPDKYIGEFNANCEARTEVTDSAITEFLYEMKRMRNGEITDEEIDAIKKYTIGSFARSLENPLTVAKFAINIERYNLPKDYYKNYLKNIDAVTKEEIISAARKYITPNKAYVIVVGNGNEIKDKIRKFSMNGKLIFLDVSGNEINPDEKKVNENISAKEILNRFLSASGGKEKLQNVKDLYVEMEGKIMNFDITLTIAQKAPNKFYSKMDAGIMQQVTKFDGNRGISKSMGNTKEMTEKEIKKMRTRSKIFPLAYFDSDSVKYSLVGIENVNGKDAFKIKAEYDDGSRIFYYFDKNSGLKIRETETRETEQGKITITKDFNEYKDFDGIKYPVKINQSLGGQLIELNVKKIKINSGLSDKLFEITD